MYKKEIITLVIITVLIITLLLAVVVAAHNDTLNVSEVRLNNLENKISIEEQEIVSIQIRLEELVSEYTDYEKDTHKMVVENISPQFVLNMYPDLKSNTMYNNLSRQFLRSTRNIKEAKNEYNSTVEKYNSKLVTLKGRVLSGGREQKKYKQ